MDSEQHDALVGTRVGRDGRILISRFIAEGGSGPVYLGWDDKRERSVALKFLRHAFSSNKVLVARFMQEGRRFAQLEHPNLVRVYGWGQAAGRLFIISEFVEGLNLYELLVAKGPLPPDRALRICRGVAAGLGEAHRHDIVHRDLKPENIMVRNRDKQPMVLDFGIAKDLRSSLELTGLGMYIGTPAYSAPEQIRGDPVDHRTDMFSLGVILYELMTGKVAFDGRHSTEVLRATLHQEPKEITEVNRIVTRPVAHLLESMIKKDPARRIQTMEDLIIEIDDLLDVTDALDDLDTTAVQIELRELFE